MPLAEGLLREAAHQFQPLHKQGRRHELRELIVGLEATEQAAKLVIVVRVLEPCDGVMVKSNGDGEECREVMKCVF